MTDRRRNTFVLLIVAALAIGSLLVTVGIPGAVKAKKTRLGLDLKGGVELVYQGKPTAQAAVTTDSLNRAIDIMRKRVDQLGVSEPEIQRTGPDQIDVALPSVNNAQRAQEQVGKTAQLYFYDWETNVIGPGGKPDPTNPAVTGGQQPGSATYGLSQYNAVLLAAKRAPVVRKNDTTLEQGCTLATNQAPAGSVPHAGCVFGEWYLLDTKGHKVLRGPEDTQQNLYADNYKAPVTAKARVVHINPGTVLARAQPTTDVHGKSVPAETWYVLDDNPVLTGADIKNPAQGFDNGAGGSGQPIVTFGFTSHGTKVFHNTTRKIAQRGQDQQLPGVSKNQALQHFAVVLDSQLITVPYIDYTANPDGIDPTTGSQIEGGFTIDTAQNLADELQSGALPIKLNLISQSQVSATLGKQALKQGLVAGLVGFAVVCLFLLLFYRVLGVIAVLGLLIYGLYYFAMIKLIPITLTLPGIAGLILTIGITADANIVIFERVKEEIRGGRSIASGIATGYRRGFAAIVDANVVTFMTAFILFALATAGIKGFAFTLGIGTLMTLFTAVLATQAALGAMGRSRLVSHPSALGAGRKARSLSFDYMGASRWFFSFSGVILLIGALAIGSSGLNFGIDFKSGTRIQTAFVKPVTENQIRDVLSKDGYPDAQIQKLSSKDIGGTGFQISTKTLGQGAVVKVKASLDGAFGNGVQAGTKNFSDTSIGPTFGKTIADSAVIAIIASLLVISAYIALRFEWKYAVPVLIALMHDLLITAGVYSLTGREVTTSTVAALLTILGYSLYDTIIVFDRVRENVPRMPRAAFSQIVNRSMSEVITRSLATSFCTLLPVLALLLFGGNTLKDFAFALLVGVASGAYSSIFIASPVLTHWKERETAYRNRRARITRELGEVSAYAAGAAGTTLDEPAETRRRNRRGSILAPEEPGEQISKEEFEDLVRDLDIEGGDDVAVGAGRGATRRGGRAKPSTPRGGSGAQAPARVSEEQRAPTPPRDPAADLLPEDVVMPGQPTPSNPAKPRKPRNRRHGRSR
ncbi:MAG TPA: protein translocase subunit SecD [Solirubrobacteraceae bacterium]|nr:protein translocase subunit SecD [Solirubrobacteraceae bacterium]